MSTNDNNTLWAIDNQPYDWANQIGCLWYFIDTLAKKGPKPISPPPEGIIGVDPVTGRAEEVNFTWYQLLDAAVYELQLSKDDIFSKQLIVDPEITPVDQTAPAWILQPGFLEVNHRYFWRLRASGSIEGEQIRSPYSATMSFIVGAGLPVDSPYQAPLLLEPANECGCPCDSPVFFTWSPFKDITKYKFELSQNSDMSDALISTDITTTSFEYNGELKCNTNYFWRVRSVEPFPSEWSATFSFFMQSESLAEPIQPVESDSQTGVPIFAIIAIIVIGVILFVSILFFIKTKPAIIRSVGTSIRSLKIPKSDIRSSIRNTENPLEKVFSGLKSNNYPTKSSNVSAFESKPSKPSRSWNIDEFFTKLKNAIIMPLRRRRYLSSKNNKDKFF
jgi:hypothetical protein